jgi:uncharacterized protein YjiS (DUF1127 family)
MSMPLSSARSLSPSRRPAGGLRGWLFRLAVLLSANRSRRALRDLDDAILRDIGLTRDEALREAERGFWDWEQVRRG